MTSGHFGHAEPAQVGQRRYGAGKFVLDFLAAHC